jgi:hypothetical protein
MWPFKKKAVEAVEDKKLKEIETPYSSSIRKLNQWINIGDKFQYMGVEFVLVKKFGVSHIFGLFDVLTYGYPDVVGEYVDSNGVFRQKKFTMAQVESIINHSYTGE